MNWWRYLLISAIVFASNMAMYFYGRRHGVKLCQMQMWRDVLANILNPKDMTMFCEAEENEFDESQKIAIVMHEKFLLEKVEKEIKKYD